MEMRLEVTVAENNIGLVYFKLEKRVALVWDESPQTKVLGVFFYN